MEPRATAVAADKWRLRKNGELVPLDEDEVEAARLVAFGRLWRAAARTGVQRNTDLANILLEDEAVSAQSIGSMRL